MGFGTQTASIIIAELETIRNGLLIW